MAKKKPLDLVAPSRIEEKELAYLNALIAAKQQADQALRETPAFKEAAAVEGKINGFTAYLEFRYELVAGDGLTPDGTIQRKAPTP